MGTINKDFTLKKINFLNYWIEKAQIGVGAKGEGQVDSPTDREPKNYKGLIPGP